MRRLFHMPLSPFSRKIRLVLAEKKIEVELVEERPWEKRMEYLAFKYHLDYMDYLLDQRRWLCGDTMTIADFAAAAQLSCLDYISGVDWAHSVAVKDWYAKVKSRPAFRSLLADQVSGPYTPDCDPLELLEAKDRGGISVYARNRDYHDVVKKKLKRLGRWLIEEAGGEIKVFVDTAPVMEKPLGAASGLGWQGKH